MFKYFPHTKEDIEAMLKVIGVKTIDDLFKVIPKEIKDKAKYNVPEELSEHELIKNLTEIANKNKNLQIFRGAGAYDHYTPSIIPYLTQRSEFLTSYTPYQPEIAQGTLQYIFEFQSYICELTGLDVANASLYDDATAAAEAMLLATSHTRNNKVLISSTVHPNIITTVKSYAYNKDYEVILIPEVEYETSIDFIKKHNDIACVIVQNPNFYGVIEDYSLFSQVIHENGGLFVMINDPQTLAVLKTPKEYDVDIAIGSGQTLGVPLSFGGPYVGYMAVKEKFLRKMPGRICGITKDVDGKRAFVLTLQAREQHIRREKANSNICSNQSLMALWVTIYTSLMGKDGLVKVNEASYTNAHYLESKLLETKYFKKVHSKPYLKEFILKTKFDNKTLEKKLINKGYLMGLPIGENKMMFAVTEKYSKEDIDKFVEVLLNELQ
ncbi:MAG: aminomethyl-transferring glycine dehydrogenase subunit GcvPA [Acholeplasmatales bacterium]